jgi:hypothetical protein
MLRLMSFFLYIKHNIYEKLFSYGFSIGEISAVRAEPVRDETFSPGADEDGSGAGTVLHSGFVPEALLIPHRKQVCNRVAKKNAFF